ncbi:MAG TPA: protealysin inhibitor emfourin [Steroidobacteraceae bacterium]|nr:protealysin inhibitor emfourin [Steroidobacteraceae bacterium]
MRPGRLSACDAQGDSTSVTHAGAIVEVERLGGLAGFGIGAARISSRGHCDTSLLSQEERAIVESLFRLPEKGAAGGADRFRIRLTRRMGEGTQTAVVPETLVPARVLACLRDELP